MDMTIKAGADLENINHLGSLALDVLLRVCVCWPHMHLWEIYIHCSNEVTLVLWQKH